MSDQENDVGLSKLPRYDGNFENWPRFKSHFDAFICTKFRGDQMVALRDALKSDESLATLSEDTLNDGVLRALLVRSCTGQAEFMITDSESGAECWIVLKQEAEDVSPARRATNTNMFNGISLTDNKKK